MSVELHTYIYINFIYTIYIYLFKSSLQAGIFEKRKEKKTKQTNKQKGYKIKRKIHKYIHNALCARLHKGCPPSQFKGNKNLN